MPNEDSAESATFHHFSYKLNSIATLDDVRLFLIDIHKGIICDEMEFKKDYIYLAYHSGVSLLGSYFSITSLQNQCIRLFFIQAFLRLMIGWKIHLFARNRIFCSR